MDDHDRRAKVNLLIFGLGRSGSSVARHLRKLGWSGQWFDDSSDPFGASDVLALGFARLETFDASTIKSHFDGIIAAPGVMMTHPHMQAAQAAGIPVWGEVELAWNTAPLLKIKLSSIGITGTAGKGSTTLLIAHLLESQGLNAKVGGNFDPPLLDVLDAEVCIVELSSFQLERIHTYHPEVAVITNIGVDHVKDHGSLEAYHRAKWRIAMNLEPQETLVLPQSLPLGIETRAGIARVAQDGNVKAGDQTLAKLEELPTTVHPMNARLGVRAALAYLHAKGRTPNLDAMRQALLHFPGVPGRFETIATIDGTRFIEDSIATRVLAVQSALENAPAPMAWIVGGRDKLTEIERESELPKLEGLVKNKVSVILAFGESGLEYAKHFQHLGVRIEDLTKETAETVMHQAAQLGLEAARGGSVVLAPLGTSFDLFKNYKARGQAFREAVAHLETPREAQA
jgi:UDP-N-acetylmuramoylalanine--D-glutamate ligase